MIKIGGETYKMTYDLDFIIEKKRSFVVVCDSDEQCAEATKCMLDIGIHHGHSGWSRKILDGIFQEGYSRWRHPQIARSTVFLDGEPYIEYYSDKTTSFGSKIAVRFYEFINMVNEYQHRYEVDDIDMTDIFEFLSGGVLI